MDCDRSCESVASGKRSHKAVRDGPPGKRTRTMSPNTDTQQLYDSPSIQDINVLVERILTGTTIHERLGLSDSADAAGIQLSYDIIQKILVNKQDTRVTHALRVLDQSIQEYILTHATTTCKRNVKSPKRESSIGKDTRTPCLDRPNRTSYGAVNIIGEIKEVWEALVERERDYLADPTYLDNHPAVQPKMRAILADWLIEVCEECVLHRETYYMALNFVDRYLSVKKNVQKKNLQGLGVTALFMASKLQEIYPPPIHQFVDITDRACSESFIIAMELEMLSVLQWKLAPVTVTAWLEVYLQIMELPAEATTIVEAFSCARYAKEFFYRMCQLLDLCTLEYGSVRFAPSVLAACAIHLGVDGDIFKDVAQYTGYSRVQLEPCLRWMSKFARLLKNGNHYVSQPMLLNGRPVGKVASEDIHNIQCHNNPFELLEQAMSQPENTELSYMTPPKSSEKNH
eukprot:m.340039 g.340039  ORF g.340039 m.340039 type:complete len:457 (+) comp19091_c0_seq1:148-1518(+)